MGVDKVVVLISRGKSAPIVVPASCPGGPKFSLPPGQPAGVTCGWSSSFPDSKGSVAGAVVYLSDKRNTTSDMRPFDFSRAANITGGTCATVSDTFAWASPAGVPQPKLASGGYKAPPKGEASKTCETKGFKYTLQFGGFTQAKCGTSVVRAGPAGGGGGRGAAPGSVGNGWVCGCRRPWPCAQRGCQALCISAYKPESCKAASIGNSLRRQLCRECHRLPLSATHPAYRLPLCSLRASRAPTPRLATAPRRCPTSRCRSTAASRPRQWL